MDPGTGLADIDKEDLDGHPVSDLAGFDIAEVGEQANALIEFDQGDEVVGSEGGHGRVLGPDPGVKVSPARKGHGAPVEAAAMRASRARRVPEALAAIAALSKQSVFPQTLPEEGAIPGCHGLGTLPGRRGAH